MPTRYTATVAIFVRRLSRETEFLSLHGTPYVGTMGFMARWEALARVAWPQPSVPGVTTLALWVAGLLVAAGIVITIAKRLGLATVSALPPPQRGAAD